MKKFLSLVLALVMTMSLVTISAGATEFKDLASAEQGYKEAIDVISDLGIVGGVTADTYEPKSTLTRGAATKFVANLMLGPDLAAKLPDGAAFTDIPAGSTFAKYASYLKSKGVIGGYGDGSYGVKNPLTGDAFLKMVLGALGYDAAAEGYGVDGWQVTVAIDAINAGLTKGLVNFDSSKNITREEAAQIVLNALEAKTVYYETNGSITIGNVVISNNSKAEYVVNTATDYDRANAYEGANVADGYMQLVEKLFPGVEKDEAATDSFGRPATAWYDTELAADKQQIVLTVDAPVKTYAVGTSNTEGQDIYADLGLTKATAVTLYVNGEQSTTGTVDKSNSNNTNDTTIWGEKGTTLEAYKDGSKVVLVQINEYLAKVGTPTGSGSSREIPLTALTSSIPVSKYKTTSFAKNDVVIFTYSVKDSKIIDIKVADEIKTGEYTKKESDATIYVDGAKLSPANSATFCNDEYIAEKEISFGNTVKAYMNSNGYYLYIEKVTETTKQDKYAYVLAGTVIEGEADWATGKDAADTYKAQLLFTDGTTAIVDTDKNYGYYTLGGESVPADDILVNNFVKYGIDAKTGKYELSDATDGDADVGAVETKKTSVKATISDTEITVSNATTYIVKTLNDKDEAVYSVYVGYKAAPGLEGEGAADYILNSSKVATYVFIDASDEEAVVPTDEKPTENVVIFRKSSTTKFEDKNGVYYTATIMIDGEKKSIEITADALATADKDFEIYTSYTINENGRYELPTAETPDVEAVAGINYVDGVLTVGTGDAAQSYALAEDVVIVYSDSATNLVEWTEADLVKDTNDQVYLYNDAETGEVEYLLIVKK